MVSVCLSVRPSVRPNQTNKPLIRNCFACSASAGSGRFQETVCPQNTWFFFCAFFQLLCHVAADLRRLLGTTVFLHDGRGLEGLSAVFGISVAAGELVPQD